MILWRFNAVIVAALMVAFIVALPQVGRATDPLRLQENFRVIGLNAYMRALTNDDHQFSLQNGSPRPMRVALQRQHFSPLASALGLAPRNEPALRVFASNDHEFIAAPQSPERVILAVPTGSVQTYILVGQVAPHRLNLWSPDYLSVFEANRQTVQLGLVSLLGLLFVIGLGVALYRRSRRALYGVVMASGLMVLLTSIWASDLATGLWIEQLILANRLSIIQVAFGFSLVMTGLGHLNLIMRRVINRNYWTRVIICADLCLLITGGLWVLGLVRPDYLGLLGPEVAHLGLAVTCVCIFLGAIFVPDR